MQNVYSTVSGKRKMIQALKNSLLRKKKALKLEKNVQLQVKKKKDIHYE